MRRYALVLTGMLAFFLAVFVVVEALGVPVLTDPAVAERGAALGVALLVVDVVLPVPSSLVMVAHGARYGAAAGTLLSLLGSTGAAVAGWWLGRRGAPVLDRALRPDDRERADAAVARWGLLAVVATRPVPLLAETVAVAAGASGLPLPRVALAAAAGSLPAALLYALAGAAAASTGNGLLVLAVVLALAGALWAGGRLLARRSTAP